MPIHEVITLLEGRLRRGLSRYRSHVLINGLIRSATVVGALALAALVAGAFFTYSPRLPLALTFATMLVLAAAAVVFVVVPWLRRLDLFGFARLAEVRLPETRSLLVNALELAPVAAGSRVPSGNTSRELAAAALAQAERRTREVDFEALAPPALPARWGRPLGVVAAAWVLAWIVAPGPLSRSAWSLLHPRAAMAESVGLEVWPGDITLAPGATLEVRARVRGSDRAPTLVFRSPVANKKVVMEAGAGGLYSSAIDGIAAAAEYRVECGPVKSRTYRVTLSGVATPVSFQIDYAYPAYTHQPAESQSATRADLVALRGTRARLTVDLDRNVERVSWTLGSAFHKQNERRWMAETVISADRPYELVVSGGGHERRMAFRVEALADRPPLLTVSAPSGDLDLPAGQQIEVAASGSDDFGLTDLSLAYETSEGARGRVGLARWPAEPRDASAQAQWDLSGLSMLPGQTATFWLELRDNDRVGGPNVTRSGRFVVRFPTLSQVYDQLENQQESAVDRMQKVADEARDLTKQVDQMRHDLTNDPKDRRGEATWEKRQAAKEAADRQQAISEKMQEITQQLEDASRQAAEHDAFRQEILDKMAEISKLVRELESPELKDAIRRLQESLQQVDPRRLEANLQKLQQAQQELLKGLERTLELLRRVRQEERLEAAARRADELAKRQETMDRRMDQAKTDEEKERAAAAQEQAARESEELRKDLEQLQKDLQKDQLQKAAEQTQEGEKTLEQQATPSLQQSAKQMRDSNRGEARRSAQQAKQSLQQASQQLTQAAKSLSDEGQRQLAEAMRRSAQDLVDLSQRQEQALQDGGSPDERAQRQQDLREGAERVADDLMKMGKQTPFLTPDASQALGRALEAVDRSEKAFSSGAQEEGQQQGQEASSNFNQAVISLRQAEKATCQGGQSGGEKSQNGQSQVKSMAGQQGQLNQDTQSLVQRLTQQQRLVAGDQEALEQLAARQEAIRRGIQDALDQQKEGDLLGRLDEAKRDMEEVEKKLRSDRLDNDLLDRQNKILSRLLDAQRSVNRREFDEKRESRTGEDVARSSPAELPRALLEPKARAERDLLKARAERYPSEYRDLVETYLRRLQETP